MSPSRTRASTISLVGHVLINAQIAGPLWPLPGRAHLFVQKMHFAQNLTEASRPGLPGLMLASGALLGRWQRRQKIAKMSQRRRARCCGAALKIPKKLRAFGILSKKSAVDCVEFLSSGRQVKRFGERMMHKAIVAIQKIA